MARLLRIEYPGAVYHITSRGNEKKPIYRDDQDRENFLSNLDKVNKRYNWLCHAYCLMDNHLHLLIETPDGNLSIGIRQFNGVYTQAFNKRHRRTGHLFQRRCKDVPEILKGQRYAARLALENRSKRDRMIREAVEKFGYTQRAVADYLGFHFTYVSRILNNR